MEEGGLQYSMWATAEAIQAQCIVSLKVVGSVEFSGAV